MGDTSWAESILEKFNIHHVPETPAAKKSVARYILGQMGQSRKEPVERAIIYQAATKKFVGKRVSCDGHIGVVRQLSVRGIDQRVWVRSTPSGYVGPFAALVKFEDGTSVSLGLSNLQLLDDQSVSE